MSLFRTRSFAIVITGFVLLGLVGGSIPFLLAALKEDDFWVVHTVEVKNRLSKITIGIQESVIGLRSYVLGSNDDYLETFNEASKSVNQDLSALALEVSDNPIQRMRVDKLRTATGDLKALLSRYVGLKLAGRGAEAVDELKAGSAKRAMELCLSITDEMEETESRLLGPRQVEAQATLRKIQVFIYGLLGLIGLLTMLVIHDTRKRFLALQTTTDQLQSSIAQEHALQAQLQQSQKMEAIGQLAGGIAHDFNNMLAVVISSLTLFKRRSKRGETNVEHFVDSALEGANRAAKLTHRLLAYSRQQPLNPQAVDANRFIADMSDLLGHALGETIRLETVLAGGLWRSYVDSSQLENSILNLSINARDAMVDGGKLTIETANAHLDEVYSSNHTDIPAGQYVMIAVTDEGVGMSKELIDKAFDPFFTTKGVGQGTGLGLSQVHGFVKQSGGHIKIYSEPGHGTTVKIYLPRHHGETERSNTPPAQIGTAAMGRAEETILVLEDDGRVRSVVVESLRELGYSVLQADHGTTALRMLDEHGGRIALLFTDVIMPDMNGRKVAEEALRKHPDLKVVYTTGFSRNAIIHNGVLNAGVNFIAKPFTLDALAQKIRSVLDAPSKGS